MNIFVGLNDAGKSNVLKALNLFFNNETEPGVNYDFQTDYSKFAPIRKNKAKEIMVSITFEIPQHYKDDDVVVWTKVWRAEGLHYDSSSEWSFSPYSKVATLLKRVHYKYVPAIKSDNYYWLIYMYQLQEKQMVDWQTRRKSIQKRCVHLLKELA